MYSVVLIEDEIWTLRGLLHTFPFEQYEMSVMDTFTDARTALDFIVQNNPDIIITDIEMPGLSGIDMIKKLNERRIHSKVVVLSAYSNFVYAQELIKQGIFEYCLKPLSSKNASDLLHRLKMALDKQMRIVLDSDIEENVSDNTRFNRMVQYINRNYKEKLTLQELCSNLGLNQDYCIKLFQTHFGCSYSEYLRKIRMEKACSLLRQNYSVAEVAKEIGFQDYYYFIRVFKKYYGVTPYAYKNNN